MLKEQKQSPRITPSFDVDLFTLARPLWALQTQDSRSAPADQLFFARVTRVTDWCGWCSLKGKQPQGRVSWAPTPAAGNDDDDETAWRAVTELLAATTGRHDEGESSRKSRDGCEVLTCRREGETVTFCRISSPPHPAWRPSNWCCVSNQSYLWQSLRSAQFPEQTRKPHQHTVEKYKTCILWVIDVFTLDSSGCKAHKSLWVAVRARSKVFAGKQTT